MTPSHVKKRNGQRYRYYLSQALLQHRPAEAGTVPRIAALAIEELVKDRIERIRAAVGINESDPAAAIRLAVERIEIARDQITISLAGAAAEVAVHDLRHRLSAKDKLAVEAGVVRIRIPVQLGSWGGETVIEGPNGTAAAGGSHLDRDLIEALAKAHEWKDMLATGKASSFRTIAKGAGCTEGYVRHIVELAFIAPDITSAILLGSQPRHLTVDRVVRHEIPISWAQQRALFGFQT